MKLRSPVSGNGDRNDAQIIPFQVFFSLHIFTLTPCIKGILSTSCVIFSYPKLLSISVLTFIKWRLNTELLMNTLRNVVFSTKINTEFMLQKIRKRPKTFVIRIIVRMTIFKSVHMAFYANTSWACALFRNNKQHVVLGQKRNCQRVEESGLWRIQR